MRKPLKAANVKLKQAYEHAAAGDGTRIHIDRLWPRGIKKADAAIDQWVKGIARQGPITLVYSIHDEAHNDAVALRSFLLGWQTSRRGKLV